MRLRGLAPFFWLTIGLFLLAAHCRKELPPCQSNCGMIVFQGDVIDGSTGLPLKGQQVNVELKWIGYCIIGCSIYDVTSGGTDANGHFILHADFDTTLLQQYYLNFYVPIPNGYLISPWEFGPGIIYNPETSSSVQFRSIDTPDLQHLQFNLYQKALLQVEFKRTSPISSRWPQVGGIISFANAGINNMGWGFNQNSGNSDTTLSFYTAANVYTKVGASKMLPDSTEISVSDSLICVPGAQNKIVLTY